MKKSLVLILLFITGVLVASVPNRITYQGRLSKNSSPVIGSHTFGVRIYPAATPAASLWQDLNIPVTLGPEGEFTIVLEIGDIDWINTDPRLEITVDGEKLSPADSFETTPYSFVAKRVDAGGVNTAALADGAVTNAKVAAGVEAAKILVSTSPGNTYLSDWRHPVSKDKIDASKIEGTIPTIPSAHGASHVAGGSDALSGLSRTQVTGTALVANSSYTQVMQAVSVSTAVLAVKGLAGSGSKILQIYDSGVLGNTGSVPVEQAWFDKDANLVTNKGITGASGVFTGLTATTGTVSTLTVGTMTVTGTTTLNRVTASSVTVAGPLNVTGTTALGSYTAASGNVTSLTAGSANIAGTATAGSMTTANLTVTNTISAPILAAPYPMMIVVDQKASGTPGGAFAGGVWATRTLNLIATNTIVGATLSANTVTLPAGVYRVSWKAPANRVNRNQTVWRNTTDSLDIILGSSEYANGGVSMNVYSSGHGVFEIPSTKSFQLLHRCSTGSSNTDSMGIEAGQGPPELYTQVEIEKIR